VIEQLRSQIAEFRAGAAPLEPDAAERRAVGSKALDHALAYWDQVETASSNRPWSEVFSLRLDPEFLELHLSADEEATFLDDAERLVRKYFELEDPTTIRPIGLELMLDADLGGVRLRGIIDRLELDENGELVVVDYKTGKAPPQRYENGRLDGVHFYSMLCERNFGRRPARIKLLYLADPLEISTRPSDQSSRGIERKASAIWSAVERACARDDFRPKPSRLCDYCAFRAYCPAFGGDITEGVRVGVEMRSAATVADLATTAAVR